MFQLSIDLGLPLERLRRLFALITRFTLWARAAELQHRQLSHLRTLDDRLLADIGLTRSEALRGRRERG